MKLSICIPTHKRPLLFTRAINSVLNLSIDIDIEIIVNNDSSDITEIHHDHIPISYSYVKSNDISDVYKHLLESSNGEFVYFLEDDDYLNPNFFKHIDLSCDITYILYTSIPHINEVGVHGAIERQNINKHLMNQREYSKFITNFNDEYFQLGQIIFNKSKLNSFPEGNSIHNDYKLFTSFQHDTTIKYINKQLWTQTIDGGDNMSFPELHE